MANINYAIKAVFLIGLALTSSIGSAQVCPAVMTIVEKVNDAPLGWAHRPMTTVHLLSGMDVVEGQLNYDDEGANATLRPIDEPNGDYVYKFNNLTGAAEAWMRCSYRETAVRLDRRIGENVIECRRRKLVPKTRGEKPIITAVCK